MLNIILIVFFVFYALLSIWEGHWIASFISLLVALGTYKLKTVTKKSLPQPIDDDDEFLRKQKQDDDNYYASKVPETPFKLDPVSGEITPHDPI